MFLSRFASLDLWSIPVNWEEDPAIKAEQRRDERRIIISYGHQIANKMSLCFCFVFSIVTFKRKLSLKVLFIFNDPINTL